MPPRPRVRSSSICSKASPAPWPVGCAVTWTPCSTAHRTAAMTSSASWTSSTAIGCCWTLTTHGVRAGVPGLVRGGVQAADHPAPEVLQGVGLVRGSRPVPRGRGWCAGQGLGHGCSSRDIGSSGEPVTRGWATALHDSCVRLSPRCGVQVASGEESRATSASARRRQGAHSSRSLSTTARSACSRARDRPGRRTRRPGSGRPSRGGRRCRSCTASPAYGSIRSSAVLTSSRRAGLREHQHAQAPARRGPSTRSRAAGAARRAVRTPLPGRRPRAAAWATIARRPGVRPASMRRGPSAIGAPGGFRGSAARHSSSTPAM